MNDQYPYCELHDTAHHAWLHSRLREAEPDAEAWRWLCDNLPEGFDGDGALEALIADAVARLHEVEKIANAAETHAQAVSKALLASEAERDQAKTHAEQLHAYINMPGGWKERAKSAEAERDRLLHVIELWLRDGFEPREARAALTREEDF